MKKIYMKVSLFLLILSILPLQSCIGSFSLTNKVISWNNQVGSKFINELVFFAFWVLPVYEVTAIADLLVINSIEFWSGTNPVEAREKTVETDHGTYYITQSENEYVIKTPNGEEIVLEFTKDNDTWNVKLSDEEIYPFMTMIDSSHVKMVCPDGSFQLVELSEEGVMAYSKEIQNQISLSGNNNNNILAVF